MYFKALLLAVALGAAALSGCSSSLAVPGEEDARLSGTPVDTLIAGRKLYLSRCSGCHNLYPPSAYTRAQWPAIVKSMEEPARTTAGEAATLLKYLEAKAKP